MSHPGYDPDEWWKALLLALLFPFLLLYALFDIADCALAEFLDRLGIH